MQALLKPSKGPGPQRSDPKRTRCHVVAIASCLGLGAVSNVSAYSASKAALLAILDSLRQEIRVLKELDPIHHSLKSSGLLVDDLYITAVCPFKIADGGMFHQIPPFPFPNLTPTVTCQHVVNVIMKELEKSCVLGTTPKTEIWVPHFVHGISYLKCLPTSIYDSVMSWMGANRSSVSVKFKRSKADLANDNSFIH